MNFLKKKKARAQRAQTKKKGSFSAEARFFLRGNTKDLAAEGCSVSVSLLPISMGSFVFFVGASTTDCRKYGPGFGKHGTESKPQTFTDSHMQPQAATSQEKS